MATQMNTMDEGRPPENINTRIDCGMDNDEINMNKNFLDNKSNSDSCKEKHPKNTPKPKRNSRKLSIVTLSKNHGRSKKYGVFSPHTIPSYHRKENGNTDTANLVGEECTFSDFVEDNSKRFRDANKNTTETTSSQVPLNIKSSIKCEKNCLKSSFVPKLLCLTKNSLEKNNLNLLTQNKNNINTKSASSDSHEKENESKYMNDSLKDEATTDTHCDNSSKPEVVIKNHTAQVNSLVAKDRESSANDEKRAGSTASSSRTSEEGDYTNYGLDKSKFRNSFHQNVEEALNSLLWQPYEYQKSNANRECECDDDDESFYSEGSHTPSWSSCSSDLDDIPSVPTKGTSTKNSIDVVGSTIEQRTSARGTILQAVECTYLRSEDLHSNANSSLLNESPGRDRSRDERFEHSTNAFEPVSSLNLAGETRVAYTAAARSQSSDRVCDVSKSNRSWLSMSHAQNATVNQSSAVTSATNSYRNTNDNGLKSYVDPLLNSANIVGLPSHHTRYASVPSTAFQNGASRSQSTIFPQHVRNTSEPATKYPQNFIPPQSSSTLVPPNAVVPLSNVVPIHRHYPEHSHFRSHSAPKSMPKNEPPTNSCANQQQVGNSRTKPPNMQNNVVPTSRSNQVYIHASDNVQNNAVPASRNGQLICSNTTSQNRYPVVHNSSNQQYQIPNHADGHQQVPNSSAQNTSIFTVNPNANNLTRPLQKPQHSPPNPGSNTPVHPIPNPRVSKIPQQQFTQVNPNQQNVSNVNVNFYRAVPVNVVSSVPTIHCLNTLSNCQGNSVSNVQVLPLGSNFQQLTQATSLTNTVSGTANVTASCTVPNNNIELSQNVSSTQLHSKNVDTATQITLHNTNAIQIAPSNGFHINRNSAFSLPQNHELRNIQVQSKSDSDTMVVPLNEVVVQNVRPTSTTNETIHGGRLITTTAQINSVTTLNSNNTQPQIMTQSTGIPRSRTFTSTEAQTDEILPVLPQQSAAEQTAAQKEQRRKERRERRHHRRAQRQNQTILEDNSTPINQQQHNERLPDILDSHLPPPYSAATSSPVLPPSGRIVPSMVPAAGSRVPAQLVPPPGMVHGAMLSHGPMLQTVVPNAVPTGGFVFPAPHQQMVPGQVPLMQGAQAVPVAVPAPATGFRFPFPANGFRRTRFSEDTPKGCCGFLSWKPGSLRWFIALIALVAVCCVLVGTALGAMRPAGRDHLTVSLLMIGVGIVLITVSGVAWRLTSHDSSTCRSMLGMGSTESVDVCTRRFVPRLPPSYGRPHHPYAAMMYPEFQYRPPPPSYQASMQEYRLRLLLLDRGNTPQIQAGLQNAVSPPPTYRSHAGSLLRAPLSSRRDATQSEYSCPPSYRSQNSSHRPATLHGSILHSREHSLSVSDSNHGESVVNIVNILGGAEEDIALDNITLDSLKMEPEHHELSTLKMLLKGSHSDLEGSKDGNLVTIVQTNDQNPVIVTVSGCSNDNNSSVQITEIPSEMEILAHL